MDVVCLFNGLVSVSTIAEFAFFSGPPLCFLSDSFTDTLAQHVSAFRALQARHRLGHGGGRTVRQVGSCRICPSDIHRDDGRTSLDYLDLPRRTNVPPSSYCWRYIDSHPLSTLPPRTSPSDMHEALDPPRPAPRCSWVYTNPNPDIGAVYRDSWLRHPRPTPSAADLRLTPLCSSVYCGVRCIPSHLTRLAVTIHPASTSTRWQDRTTATIFVNAILPATSHVPAILAGVHPFWGLLVSTWDRPTPRAIVELNVAANRIWERDMVHATPGVPNTFTVTRVVRAALSFSHQPRHELHPDSPRPAKLSAPAASSIYSRSQSALPLSTTSPVVQRANPVEEAHRRELQRICNPPRPAQKITTPATARSPSRAHLDAECLTSQLRFLPICARRSTFHIPRESSGIIHAVVLGCCCRVHASALPLLVPAAAIWYAYIPLITLVIDSSAAIIHVEASDPSARATDEGALVSADRRVCGSGAGHIPIWWEWISGCTVGVHARMEREHSGVEIPCMLIPLTSTITHRAACSRATRFGWRSLYSPVCTPLPDRMAKVPAARDATGPVQALHLSAIRQSRRCHARVLNQLHSPPMVLGIHKTLQAIISLTHTTTRPHGWIPSAPVHLLSVGCEAVADGHASVRLSD
ncbi:hypothetical protein B0H19DRAFT_1277650 [Mycena capillaripes]|nr:hypothetical protein B0H19DRAFT_1277650 [Mycena capillaripes]